MTRKQWSHAGVAILVLAVVLLPGVTATAHAVAGRQAIAFAAERNARAIALRQSPLSSASGRTVVVGYDTPPYDFNPYTSVDLISPMLFTLVNDSLVTVDPSSFQPTPDLARSWEITNGGRTYTFHLRPGVRFPDGRALTVDDVVWNFKLYDKIWHDTKTVIKNSDPLTVRITLATPSANFLVSGLPVAMILEKRLYQQLPYTAWTKPNWGTNFKIWPVGAGAWTIKAVVKDDHVTLAANPYYFRGRPKIGTLILKTVPDDSALFEQLQSGEVQATPLLSRFLTLVDRNRFNVYSSPGLLWYSLRFNFHNQLFVDWRVRQAFMYAIDRAGIVKAVYHGQADLMNSGLPLAYREYYDANVPNKYPYDAARAKALLTAAGWKPGSDGILVKGKRRFAFTIQLNRSDAQVIQAGTIIQQDLANVGISVHLLKQDDSTTIANLNKESFDGVLIYFGDGAYPGFTAYNFAYGCHQTLKEGGFNWYFYCNPRLDRLMAEANSAIGLAAQQRVFNQMQVLMNQELPWIWLYAPRRLWVMDRRIRGYKPNPLNGGDLWNAWQWSM